MSPVAAARNASRALDSSISSGARGDLDRPPPANQRRSLYRAIGMIVAGAIVGASLLWLLGPGRSPSIADAVHHGTETPNVARAVEQPIAPETVLPPAPAKTGPFPASTDAPPPTPPQAAIEAPVQPTPERKVARPRRREPAPAAPTGSRLDKKQWTGNKTRIIE